MQVAHRSALAEALYKGCKNSSSRIKVHFHTAVINVDFDNHRIQVKNLEEDGEGKWVDVDIVLGADGIKSSVRMFLRARNGEEDEGKLLPLLNVMIGRRVSLKLSLQEGIQARRLTG